MSADTGPPFALEAGEAFELLIGEAIAAGQAPWRPTLSLKAFIAIGSTAEPACEVEPPSLSLHGRVLLQRRCNLVRGRWNHSNTRWRRLFHFHFTTCIFLSTSSRSTFILPHVSTFIMYIYRATNPSTYRLECYGHNGASTTTATATAAAATATAAAAAAAAAVAAAGAVAETAVDTATALHNL